jgi:MOSC domain-containing protein YiiM
MRIHSLQLGAITTQVYDGATLRTAGHKQPVASARLTRLGLVGDEQADRRYHGGPDQALCAYAFENYPVWERELGLSLSPGAFSENLTLLGLNEESVAIGDILGIGPPGGVLSVEVQVSLPRQPCGRLAGKLGVPDLVGRIKETGRTGFYLRVLREGEIRSGDAISILQRDPHGVSVTETNQVMFRQRCDRASLVRVLAVEALAPVWRRRLEARL